MRKANQSYRSVMVRMRAVLVCLVAAAFVIVCLPAGVAHAADYQIKDDWVKSHSEQIKHGDAQWQPLVSGANIDYGDQFRMTVNFEVPNDVQLKQGDTLTYDLPEGIDYITGTRYPLTDDTGAQTGSYIIQDNKIIATYTGADGLSDMKGHFTIDGTINRNQNDDNDGGETEFKFPGAGTVTVNLNAKHELDVTKNGAINVPNSRDEFDFVIDVTSVGGNTQVQLNDVMGDLLELEAGTIAVYTDRNCTQSLDREHWQATESGDKKGFALTIDSMKDETFYVKYRVKLTDRDAAVEACKNNACTGKSNPQYQLVNNAVTYKSDENTDEETSEKGIWLTDLWQVYKRGEEGGARNSIKWTLEIWPGKDGYVDGTTIKDTLGDHLQTPTVEPTIACYTRENMWGAPVDCGESLSWQSLADGTAKLPTAEGDGRGYGRYVITYETATDDDGASGTYRNTMTVRPDDGTPERDVTGEGTIKEDADLTKRVLSASKDGGTLTWQTDFTANHDLDNARITDTLDVDEAGKGLGPFQTFDRNSVAIYTDAARKHPWTGGWTYEKQDDSGFTIKLDSVSKGTTLFIVYTSTVMAGHENDTLYNTVAYGGKTSTAKHESKQIISKMSTSAYGDSGRLTWGILVYNLSPSATSVTITDTLPEFYGYAAQTMKAYKSRYWPKTPLEGVSVRDNRDGTITIIIDPESEAYAWAQENGENYRGLWLEYETELIDYEGMMQDKKEWETSHPSWESYRHTAENRASIAVDGESKMTVTASKAVTPPPILDKTYTYDATTAPNIEYTIEVNKTGVELNAGRTLTLTDTLGESLALRMDSVAITDKQGAAIAGATYAYNPQTREMTLRVPDATPCYAKYKATLLLGEGQQIQNASNTVTLKGHADDGGSKDTEVTGEVQHTQGGLGGAGHAFQVFKYMDGNIGSPRVGVRFTVEAMQGTVDDDGRYVLSGTNPDIGPVMIQTGATGYTPSAGMRADTVYRVTENPDDAAGFEAAEPLYVLFPGAGTDVQSVFGNELTVIDRSKDASSDKTSAMTVAQSGQETLSSYVWVCANVHTLKATLNIGKTNRTDVALSGADLRLSKLSGEQVATWTTTTATETHKIGGLAPGTYILSETKAPDGYQTAEDIVIVITADGKITVDGKDITDPGATIEHASATVVMRDEPQTTSLKARKIWDDADDQDGLRRDVVFDLYRRVGDGEFELVPGQTRVVAKDADDAHRTVTWTDLPVRTGDQATEYEIREREIPTYTTTQTTDAATGVIEFTNTHTPDVTQLHVRKTWKDVGDEDHLRPENVSVQLTANGVPVEGKSATLNAGNQWSCVFADLPKYADGSPIVYGAVETDVPSGYEVTYAIGTQEGSDDPQITVTNTHTPKSEKARFSKRDVGGIEIPGATLELAGTPTSGESFTAQTWTTNLTETKEWELQTGTYTLTETKAPSGYTPAEPITFTVERDADGNLQVKRDGQSVSDNVIVMTDQYATTPIKVSKRTMTGGHAEVKGARLQITGNLLDGTAINKIEWVSDGTMREFSLLPGNYVLRELEAPSGYEIAADMPFSVTPQGQVTVGGLMAADNTVTMMDAPRTTDVYFSKKAIGGIDELAGASFTLEGTTFEGEHVQDEWTSTGEMHMLTMQDGRYTLTETQAPDGYEPVDPMRFTIEQGRITLDGVLLPDAIVQVWNERTPVTSVSVNKQWQDNADQDGKRPESVRIQLLADGEEIGDVVELNAANNWTYTWADLNRRSTDGEPVNYTVRELLDGEFGTAYHVSIVKNTATTGTNYRVVNIHQPESTNLELTKLWDDADDQDGKRPESIGISVWGISKNNDGNEYEEQMIDQPELGPDEDTGAWHWVFQGLPKKNLYGNDYRYVVRESEMADYTVVRTKHCTETGCAPVSENEQDEPWQYEITNRHEPETIDIPVTKIWSDNNNVDNARPDKAVVWLLGSTVDGSNGWPTAQYTFTQSELTNPLMQPAQNKQDNTFTQLDTDSLPTVRENVAKLDGECVTTWAFYGKSCLILKRSGAEEADPNRWTGTFAGVPKYHKGEEIRYMLTEQEPEGASYSHYEPTLERTVAPVGSENAGKPDFVLRNTELVELPSTGYSGPFGPRTLMLIACALLLGACMIGMRLIHLTSKEGAR